MWTVIALVGAITAFATAAVVLRPEGRLRTLVVGCLLSLGAVAVYGAYGLNQDLQRLTYLVSGALSPNPAIHAAVAAEVKRVADGRGLQLVATFHHADGVTYFLTSANAAATELAIVLEKPEVAEIYANLSLGRDVSAILNRQFSDIYNIDLHSEDQQVRANVLVVSTVQRVLGRSVWGVHLDAAGGLVLTVANGPSGRDVTIPFSAIAQLPHATAAGFQGAVAGLLTRELRRLF